MPHSTKLFSFDFSGKVEDIYYSDSFPTGRPISKGNKITGNFAYDLSAEDTYSKPEYDKSQYPHTAFYQLNPMDDYYGFTATIKGNEFLTNPDRVLVSYNETYNKYGDRIFIRGVMITKAEFRGKESSSPFDLNKGYITWELQDESMNAISSPELPTEFNLIDWKLNRIKIKGERYDSEYDKTLYDLEIIGTIESAIPVTLAPPTGLRIV